MKLQFDKYSVHGNDFLVFDNRESQISTQACCLFKKICARRTSVGADGVILISTEKPDFCVRFYNPDGNPALMCGNGSRAAVDFARKRKIIEHEAEFSVNNVAHRVKFGENQSIGIELHVEDIACKSYAFNYENRKYTGYLCDSGVPHIVFLDLDISDDAFLPFAQHIRCAPQWSPQGVNVNSVRLIDKNTITIKTYERGVEDFTLSCGTGAVASACVVEQEQAMLKPIKVRSEEGTLLITGSDNAHSLWLWGSVTKVYSGIIDDA